MGRNLNVIHQMKVIKLTCVLKSMKDPAFPEYEWAIVVLLSLFLNVIMVT